MRILVVDDEPPVLLLVAANVRAMGHEPLTAETVEDAERLCEDRDVDVLLLDVSMPGVDGPTFLRRLRETGREPPHVYLLSAIPPEELTELAVQLGVDHISKPFTARALREALRRSLEEAS